MEINHGYKHPRGSSPGEGFTVRCGRPPPTFPRSLSPLPRQVAGTRPKKTQVEGKIGTKKLIHKQATQGARTGNTSPSVKPSSPWRQEATHPARTLMHTHKVNEIKPKTTYCNCIFTSPCFVFLLPAKKL